MLKKIKTSKKYMIKRKLLPGPEDIWICYDGIYETITLFCPHIHKITGIKPMHLDSISKFTILNQCYKRILEITYWNCENKGNLAELLSSLYELICKRKRHRR